MDACSNIYNTSQDLVYAPKKPSMAAIIPASDSPLKIRPSLLPTSSAKLAKVKEVKTTYDIKMGLPNLSNTCWLNSAVKFMATTNHYDDFLNLNLQELCDFQLIHPSRYESLSLLLEKLNQVIATLRKNSCGGIMDESLYIDFVAAIQHANILGDQGSDPFIDQFDAAEFIRSLMSAFAYPIAGLLESETICQKICEKYPQSIWLFSHKPGETHRGSVKFPVKENYAEELVIENPDDQDCGLDLMDIISPVSSVQDVAIDRGLDPAIKKTTFLRQRYLINAPQTLMLNFIRAKPSDPSIKSERPILFHSGIQLHTPIYKANQFNEKYNTPVEISAFAVYQVEGILRKFGKAESGHWVSYQRASDGTYICHNDGNVTSINEKEMLDACQQSSLLRLRKINTINLG